VEAERGRADDYYLAEGTGFAQRYSAGGDGQVQVLAQLDGDAYEAWVSGVDPGTGAPRGRLRQDEHALRFAEVVVNGPKSWSIAAELHPDIAQAYAAAQDRAAVEIMAWMGRHATTGVGGRGGQVATPVERIEAVAVRHYTSRAGDPHRHIHLQINARVFAAGRWRGIDSVAVRDSIGAVQGIGHAAVMADPGFRQALAAHGFTLEPDTGEVVELAGFVEPFSKRAEQVAAQVTGYETQWRAGHPAGEPGPGLRRAWDARAWAEHRPGKAHLEPAQVAHQRWVDELAGVGYQPPARRAELVALPVGRVGRDQAAAEVLARLTAARSAWNQADLRGQVELLLAREGVIVEAGVRGELAEDITARAAAAAVPLLARDDVPEHVRAWTSAEAVAVEADLAGRLAARGVTDAVSGRDADAGQVAAAAAAAGVGLDPAQADAAAALAGGHALVLVTGAAGAGKTTTLSATRTALEQGAHQLLVVTPTLKAARGAAAETGARTGSAAWLVFQHGWRWDEAGRWTRLEPGQVDPGTGREYRGPGQGARPNPSRPGRPACLRPTRRPGRPATPARPHPTRPHLRAPRRVGWPGGISPPGSHGTERDGLPSLRSCHLDHQRVPDPGPVGKEPGILRGDTLPGRPSLPLGSEPLIFLADPAHQVGVDARQEAAQCGAVERPVIVHPATDDRVDHPRELGEAEIGAPVKPPPTHRTT